DSGGLLESIERLLRRSPIALPLDQADSLQVQFVGLDVLRRPQRDSRLFLVRLPDQQRVCDGIERLILQREKILAHARELARQDRAILLGILELHSERDALCGYLQRALDQQLDAEKLRDLPIIRRGAARNSAARCYVHVMQPRELRRQRIADA